MMESQLFIQSLFSNVFVVVGLAVAGLIVLTVLAILSWYKKVPQGKAIVRTGSGPFRSTVDRAPCVLLRRTGQNVHFAAVLSAETAAAPSAITAVHALEGRELGVRIDRSTASDVITWDGGGKVTFTRGHAR